MTEPVPLAHLLHVLPPSSRARLALVMQRGVHLECLTTTGPGGAQTILIGRLDGRTLRTSAHAWIAPALVQELLALLDAPADPIPQRAG